MDITSELYQILSLEEIEEIEEKSIEGLPASLQEVIDKKGLSYKALDGSTIGLKQAINFSNLGKTRAEDYMPDEDELDDINACALITLSKEDVFVIPIQAADTKVDRGYEHFTVNGLESFVSYYLGKPLLLDHNWTTGSEVGRIFAARVENEKLMVKAYIPNTGYNKKLITNILMGVHCRASVGFSIDIANATCDSCNKKSKDGEDLISIFDQDCPHRPGMMDQYGKKTTVTLNKVADVLELSVVPVPMQRDSGMRKSLNKEDIMENTEQKSLEDITEEVISTKEETDSEEVTNEVIQPEINLEKISSDFQSQLAEIRLAIKLLLDSQATKIEPPIVENTEEKSEAPPDSEENLLNSDKINNRTEDSVTNGNKEMDQSNLDNLLKSIEKLEVVSKSIEAQVTEQKESVEAIKASYEEKIEAVFSKLAEKQEKLYALVDMLNAATEQSIHMLEKASGKTEVKLFNQPDNVWAKTLNDSFDNFSSGG